MNTKLINQIKNEKHLFACIYPEAIVSDKNFFTKLINRSLILAIAMMIMMILLSATIADSAISYRSRTIANSTDGLLILNKPNGTIEGDLLIIQIVFDGGSNSFVTAPSGWSQIGSQTNQTNNVGQCLYYKIASSSEPTSYNITWTTSSRLSATGGMACFYGVDYISPIAVSSDNSGLTTSSNRNLTALGVTAPTNSVAVAFFGFDAEGSLLTPSGMTSLWSFSATGGPNDRASYVAVSGPTGNKISTAGGNYYWVANLIALTPAPAPTIASLGSTNGCVGSSITINGTYLSGATATNIKIGGTSAVSITSNSGTVLVAVIGNGTTGTVSVTTPGGTATSAANFTVNAVPSQPSVITGSTTPCSRSSQGYSVTNVPGVNYVWYFPSDWVQTGGGTSSSVTVNVGAAFGQILVTPKIADCAGTPRTKTVTVNAPDATVTGQTNISCYAADDGTITIHASGGISPYSYSVDNGSTWISSTTDPYTYGGRKANTAYKIRVKDSNGCTSPLIP